MAKFRAIMDTDEGTDLSADNQRTGQNPKYSLLAPGFYTATVTKIEDDNWRGKYKSQETKENLVNPNSPDGLWDYAKVKVTFEVHDEVGHLIQRQMTVGVIRTGKDENGEEFQELIRPEGGREKLIWGGDSGALFFYSAIGLVTKISDKQHELLPVDTKAITGRVLTIRVAQAGYIKSAKKNFKPAELAEELVAFNGGVPYTFDQLPELVERYNSEKGLTEDGILRLKNEITGYYPLRAQQIIDGSFYRDDTTGAVYVNEEAFVTEQELNEQESAANPDW